MIIINFMIKMNLINKGFFEATQFFKNYELERRGKNEYIYIHTHTHTHKILNSMKFI